MATVARILVEPTQPANSGAHSWLSLGEFRGALDGASILRVSGSETGDEFVAKTLERHDCIDDQFARQPIQVDVALVPAAARIDELGPVRVDHAIDQPVHVVPGGLEFGQLCAGELCACDSGCTTSGSARHEDGRYEKSSRA